MESATKTSVVTRQSECEWNERHALRMTMLSIWGRCIGVESVLVRLTSLSTSDVMLSLNAVMSMALRGMWWSCSDSMVLARPRGGVVSFKSSFAAKLFAVIAIFVASSFIINSFSFVSPSINSFSLNSFTFFTPILISSSSFVAPRSNSLNPICNPHSESHLQHSAINRHKSLSHSHASSA